jgi:replicative DNA helicase
MQTPTFAEEAVLGAILIRNENFHDAANLLTADHFTTGFHKKLWGALRDRILAGDDADQWTIAELMPEMAADVITVASNCITSKTIKTYVSIVRENWRKRESSAIAQRLLTAARAGEDGVNEAIGDLLRLNATVTECEFTGKQALQMAWEQASEAHANGGKLPGITTGLSDLDEILGGWHNSDLTLIGARPAMGKTALMLNLAEASSDAGVPTGIISAEQPANQIGIRRLSLASGVGAAAIRAGRIDDGGWGKVTGGLKAAKDRPLWIYDRSAVTLDELIAIGRKWKHAHNIGILFIDYAQRITVPGADRITEVSAIARGLKNLARDLQIPVVSLAQVKAEVDKRDDKRPNQGDLANSDELTREADQILMLYREAAYNHNLPKDQRGTAEILIEKNRHGPTGFKRVAFLEETMRFGDLAYDGFA